MAGTSSPEIKFPIRRAPPVPKNNSRNFSNNSLQDLMTLGNDPFNMQPLRSEVPDFMKDRKKPPPRPPPPKIKTQRHTLNLFGSKDSKRNKTVTAVVKPLPATPVTEGTLIDLNSPSSSPTFTKPSNDLISVSSIESGFNSRSNSSLIEGFEDDFDPFSGSNRTTPGSDPWSDSTDPFSPPKKAPGRVKAEPSLDHQLKGLRTASGFGTTAFTMPTIIRPVKTNKPCRPPPPAGSADASSGVVASRNMKNVEMRGGGGDPWARDSSPPMPSAPAPPPPPEAVNILLNGPPIPPRPVKQETEAKAPHCIAEYDFVSEHPDDLSFMAGDVISLTSRVNEEWFTGRLHGKEGMFPESYVKIVVPLENESQGERVDMTVIALFPFNAQTWDDLDFSEGDEITVTRRLNEDWLYGECNGKCGQFPQNFVQDISDLVSGA